MEQIIGDLEFISCLTVQNIIAGHLMFYPIYSCLLGNLYLTASLLVVVILGLLATSREFKY